MTWHKIKMLFNYIFKIHIFEYKNENVIDDKLSVYRNDHFYV